MCSSSNCYVPFFTVYWIFYAVFGITFQAILIYLITKKSPATLDNLKVFLYNTSFVQLTLIMFAFSTQHRVLSNSSTCAVLPMGPCRLIGSNFCFGIYHFFMANSFLVGLSISITVLFRFLVLVQNEVSSRQTHLMVAASYIVPLVVLILPFTENWNFEHVQHESAIDHPSYNFTIYPNFPGFANIKSFQFLAATLLLSVGAYGIPIGCLFLTRKVLILIRYHQHMSDRTKKQAQTLIYGLIVQSMIPVFSYVPMFSSWVYSQSTGVEMLITEHLILATSALPGLIDPFVSFYFIVPYRQAILEIVLFFLPQRRVRSSAITVTNNSFSGAT